MKRKVISWSAAILALLIYPMNVNAVSFKGSKPGPTSEARTFVLGIDRFLETTTDFLIVISDHAAFYRLSKDKNIETQVRAFLNKKIKDKQKMAITIDLVTGTIILIEDPKNKIHQ